MNLIKQNDDERLRTIEREIIANGCKGSEDVIVKSLRASLSREEGWKRWVDDLQSGNYITCMYCGHRYGPRESTPISMADILKEHIEKCPKHPMSKLKTQLMVYQKIIKYAQHLQRSEDQQCCDLLAKGFGFEKKCTCGLSEILYSLGEIK